MVIGVFIASSSVGDEVLRGGGRFLPSSHAVRPALRAFARVGRLAFAAATWNDGGMNAASPTQVSFEDYLVGESTGDVKHEWCDGVVYAMSRGTPEHARLTMRIARSIGAALGKGCEVYSSDLMLYVEAAKLSTYADVSVVCGAVETKTVRKNGKSLGEAVTNPTLIVEVLSEATERYDRDGKFQAYRRLSSLQEYILVSQDERCIEVYRREGDDWRCETGGRGATVTVHGMPIAVDDVYE
jgi:Uma2 family endonuclease